MTNLPQIPKQSFTMKWNSLLSGILLLVVSLNAQAQNLKISASIPTIQQEATSIWRTINDIKFFEQMGYTVNLPEDELIEALKLKSKEGNFSNDDFSSIYNLLESGVYNQSHYQAALQKVDEQQAVLKNALQQLESFQHGLDWEFRTYANYDIVFTLYGSGGSYDPNTGVITLFTTKQGAFKNYKNPANTIIHEIVHIGIENSLIQKYSILHMQKERIVDKFVYLMFGDLLPQYKIQDFGNLDIDAYIKGKDDLKNLDSALEEYASQN